MGIGAAFATGLVKGFTQNIEKEEARRLAEQAKVDRIEELAIQASFDPKKDTSGIFPLIKSARQKFNEREPIGPFGRATDGIDLDLAKMQSSLQRASDYEAQIGSYGFDYNVFGKGGKVESPLALNSMYRSLSSKEQSRLKNLTAPQLSAFIGTIQTHMNILTNEYDAELKRNGGDTNLVSWNPAKTFKNIQPYLDQLVALKTGVVKPDGADTNIASGASAIVSTDELSRTVDNNGSIRLTINFNDETYGNAYGQLADGLGIERNKFAEVFDSQLANITGFDLSRKTRALNGAATIINTFGRDLNLDSESPNFNLMEQATAEDVLSKLRNATNNDPIAMQVALALMVPLTDWDPSSGNINVKDVSTTNRLYGARLIMGRNAEEKDFNKIKDRDTEVGNTIVELNDYVKLLQDQVAAAGEGKSPPIIAGKAYILIAAGKAAARSLLGRDDSDFWGSKDREFIDARFVTQYGSSTMVVSQSEVVNLPTDPDGDPVKYVTKERLAELNAGIKAKYNEGYKRYLKESNGDESFAEQQAIQFAKLEASRIALAFQMARAADPSGRLSNQDIDAQLVRLGSNWDTPEIAIERATLALNQFQRQKDQYSYIIQIADSSGRPTPLSKKQIKGAYTFMQLSKKAGYRTPITAASGTKSEEEAGPTLRDTKLWYWDSMTNTIRTRDPQNKYKTVQDATPEELETWKKNAPDAWNMWAQTQEQV